LQDLTLSRSIVDTREAARHLEWRLLLQVWRQARASACAIAWVTTIVFVTQRVRRVIANRRETIDRTGFEQNDGYRNPVGPSRLHDLKVRKIDLTLPLGKSASFISKEAGGMLLQVPQRP
jgi:hypothetical protein